MYFPKKYCQKVRIRIGQTIMLKPTVTCDRLGRTIAEKQPGKLVYINWPHRYFAAKFYFNGGGCFRESFKFITKEDIPCPAK